MGVRDTDSGLVNRLRSYRPADEWGDPVHHVICDSAANRIQSLEAQVAKQDALLREALTYGHRLPSSLCTAINTLLSRKANP